MDGGMTVLIMAIAFVLTAIPGKKTPPKSVEQELGEAIGKYLEKGIKVRVEMNSKE